MVSSDHSALVVEMGLSAYRIATPTSARRKWAPEPCGTRFRISTSVSTCLGIITTPHSPGRLLCPRFLRVQPAIIIPFPTRIYCRRCSASSVTSCTESQTRMDLLETPGSNAGGFFVGRQQCPHIGALVPDDLRQKMVDERLDLVGTENRREVRYGRRRTVGKAVTGALGVGAVEPTGHLRARKPAADGLDEGCAIKLRLAQARASRKFAAGAAFSHRAVALKASGLVPRLLSSRQACCILREGRHRNAKPQSRNGGARDRVASAIDQVHLGSTSPNFPSP